MKKKRNKLAMYNEMPKVYFGKFSIAQMTDKEDEDRIWIQNENDDEGEGGEFNGKDLEGIISEFFDKFF